MKELIYKEIDHEGHDTLDAVAVADNFNEWMYNTIRPHCKGQILEVGSGIGNISQFFLKNKADLTLSDIRQTYCDVLKKKFKEEESLQDIILLDLVADNFDNKYKELLGSFDTVFALNVVEHIRDDELAIKNCKKLLRKDGHLIILVPAFQQLYNRFDEELYHFRRYTSTSLIKLFKKSNIEILHRQYFNFVGMFGWFFTGKILKKKTIPKGQMGLYNKLVPVIKIADKLLFNKIGLSVIVVGRR